MINLIPKEEKKKMIADFRYRLVVLFFVVMTFCMLIACLCLLPAYFNSSVNNSLASRELEAQTSEPLPVLGAQSMSVIKDMNAKIAIIETSEKNKFPISTQVINPILLNKRSDVKITQISYENNRATGKKITLTGTAPSREVLLLFKESLEQSPNFKSVDLPISNFVKGSNIEFYLSAVPS